MHRLRFPLALVSFALATVGATHGATRVVPDQYATVQSALTAAVTGDTVFVRAGTYNESLSLSGKDVVFQGESDAWDVYLQAGHTYSFHMNQVGTGDWHLLLFSNPGGRSGSHN